MTDYIEEMMKTCGIGYIVKCKKGDEYTNNCVSKMSCEDCYNCLRNYPEFTPEKQMEIIKLIGKTKDFNCFWSENDKEWFFSAGLTLPVCFDFQESNKDFTQALAQLTTELMRAGELDKQKVKEILKK